MSQKYVIISCGEPIGIGYELTLRTLKFFFSNFSNKNIIPIVVGNSFWLNYINNFYNLNLSPLVVSNELLNLTKDLNLPKNKYLLIDVSPKIKQLKEIKKFSGKISFLTLENATSLAKYFLEKNINFVLLTMPVSKNKIQKQTKRKFSGHTEYLAKKFNIPKNKVSMLMFGKSNNTIYKVLLLTRHIPLKDISLNLKPKNIVGQIENTVKFLREYEKLNKVEILFCGLNPHLGDNGKIGTEEKTKLSFAEKILKKKFSRYNLEIKFPILTEEAFKYAKNKKNVLIVCNYHDQAMLPLKILCEYKIANITVGLPFLRISPGHGTAEDIMLKNKVDISGSLFCLEKILSYLKWKH